MTQVESLAQIYVGAGTDGYKAPPSRAEEAEPEAQSAVGRVVRGVAGGEFPGKWGEVVTEHKKAYRLDNGRVAKKKDEGTVWLWDDTAMAAAGSPFGQEYDHPAASTQLTRAESPGDNRYAALQPSRLASPASRRRVAGGVAAAYHSGGVGILGSAKALICSYSAHVPSRCALPPPCARAAR